jgi:hypothetical protein
VAEKFQVKEGTVTGDMVAAYEANNRQVCIFCENEEMAAVSDYLTDGIPEGYSYQVFECAKCNRMWREITKIEEIERL